MFERDSIDPSNAGAFAPFAHSRAGGGVRTLERDRTVVVPLRPGTAPAPEVVPPVVAEPELLPVLPALAPLLPGGGLRPGTAVSVTGDTGLLLALGAGAFTEKTGDAAWAAAVGLPELGLSAAAGYGYDLRRLLLADHPGPHWPDVVAALAGAVGLILLRPTGPVAPALAARLTAVLRRTRCALLVAGPWPGATQRLSIRTGRWFGLGDGHGQLAGRQVEAVAEGRGTATRPRTAHLWLPDATGTARPLAPAAEPTLTRPALEAV
ncbi:hypothetical protein [Kitasatospora griseola]|uniref:hypothetical protein n=1 Tax=Kitasatospora griseola TaxID=2064 RepID=UPI0019B77413|nr:hypothetical protein [Kitasatospora griseola]GGQ59118.1 hypothetical protein GCM10010195_13390 [Kitasatospora griseola]